MRSKKVMPCVIAVMAVILAVVICYFLFTVESPLINHVKFSESVNQQEIKPYHDTTDNIYYIFIPSYAGIEDMEMECQEFVSASVSGENADITTFPLNENITLKLKNFGKSEEYTLQFLQSENLPAMYIETESGSMDYVNEDKENTEDASVLMIAPDGEVTFSELSTISGRGNSTWDDWNAQKRPYNLEFDYAVNLFGGINADTWCLLANYSDDSEIRNAISYYMAREMGIEYTSEIEFIELYTNGEYQGIYNIATKQAYLEDESISTVFEQSRSDKIYDYVTDAESYIRFRYGEDEFVENAVNAFEKALYAEDATYAEISQYIDTTSFAKKYLVEAFTKNVDSEVSQYFSIDEAGKITAICAWDYDLTFGTAWDVSYEYTHDASYNSDTDLNPWYNRLLEFDEFVAEVIAQLDENYSLLNNDLPTFIDSCCELIANDWQLNHIRWQNILPFYYGKYELTDETTNTLSGQQAYIKDFIKKELPFMREYLADPGKFSTIQFTDEAGKMTSMTVHCETGTPLTAEVLPGGILEITDETFLGWFTEDGTEITDVTTVDGDLTFYASWDEAALEEESAREATIETSATGGSGTENQSLTKRIRHALKEVYLYFGLDSFGWGRIAVCGIFGLALVVLVIVEICNGVSGRKSKK